MIKTKLITLLLTMTALSGAAAGGNAATAFAAELPECQHST